MASGTRSLLFEIVSRCMLFATQGRSGPFAASLGWDEYQAFLRAKDRKRRWQELQRLKQQRLISIRKKGERVLVVLTDAGRTAVLKEQIRHTKRPLPKGIYCMIVFDFPEDVRVAREVFRKFLKEADFKKLQQSVWVSPYDVLPLMHELIHRLKCREWAQVFLVRSSLSILNDKRQKLMT